MTVEADKTPDARFVLFFDIDNTLYSQKAGVGNLMVEYIKNYIKNELHLDDESADMLHRHYYRDYGLAIEGLVRFNHIDAMDYNKKVDDALPLDQIIKPDPKLRDFLLTFDKSRVELWLLTNAYITHAERVVHLLGLEGIFEGVTYCDYNEAPLICKPKPEMFEKAMRQAGVSDKNLCYFVDDSVLNVNAAMKFGWRHTIYYAEPGFATTTTKVGHDTVTSLYELPKLLPKCFFPPEHLTSDKSTLPESNRSGVNGRSCQHEAKDA